MEGLPKAVVEDLSIFEDGDLRLLRAALVSRGVWERDISETPRSVGRTFLRAFDSDSGRRNPPLLFTYTDPIYGLERELDKISSPDILLVKADEHLDFLPGDPNEADFYHHNKEQKKDLGPGEYGVRLGIGQHVGHVLVHHRHTQPLPAHQIDVHAFLWRAPGSEMTSQMLIDDAWQQAVFNTVRNGTPLPANLGVEYLGLQHPGKDVDARMPSAAKFVFNLAKEPQVDGAPRNDQFVFFAILDMPGMDLVPNDLNFSSLVDIVMHNSTVAVRPFVLE